MDYWVSVLIQDSENSQPWLSRMLDSRSSLSEAKEIIEKYRNNFRVLSAWVDTYGENKVKTTVFHECYVDTLGDLNQ